MMSTTLFILSVSLGCTLITLAYNLFFAPSRADKKDIEKRLTALELHNANHEVRLTGFQGALEKAVDSLGQRCQAIESQLNEVGKMREEMAGIKAEMKHVVEGYGKLDRKIDKLFELLRTK